jgi:hypothetical protein
MLKTVYRKGREGLAKVAKRRRRYCGASGSQEDLAVVVFLKR